MRSWIGALLICLVAGSASAGGDPFSTCPAPGAVPEDVFDTLESEASVLFGELDENVCQKIVDKGVKLCKAQVKSSAKCWDKDSATVRNIAVKQCKQLEDPVERENCKAFFNEQRDAIDEDTDLDREDGLAECEADFAEGLALICALGVPA